jgi:hypothetical protein
VLWQAIGTKTSVPVGAKSLDKNREEKKLRFSLYLRKASLHTPLPTFRSGWHMKQLSGLLAFRIFSA